jgi:hypothetical protein
VKTVTSEGTLLQRARAVQDQNEPGVDGPPQRRVVGRQEIVHFLGQAGPCSNGKNAFDLLLKLNFVGESGADTGRGSSVRCHIASLQTAKNQNRTF